MNRKRPALAVAILKVIILGVFLHAQNKPVIPEPFSPGTDGVGYPSCLSCPEPQYSEEALKAKFQGITIEFVSSAVAITKST